MAGLTYSPDFRVTTGAVQTKFGGTCDAFVAKLGQLPAAVPTGAVGVQASVGGVPTQAGVLLFVSKP